MSQTIPIFPIDIVLFPNQKVPLKIFEPRYRQMLDDCMSASRTFGINVIDGQKTDGGWASPVKTGTLVYIVCLLYTSPSPRDVSTSRMPSSA